MCVVATVHMNEHCFIKYIMKISRKIFISKIPKIMVIFSDIKAKFLQFPLSVFLCLRHLQKDYKSFAVGTGNGIYRCNIFTSMYFPVCFHPICFLLTSFRGGVKKQPVPWHMGLARLAPVIMSKSYLKVADEGIHSHPFSLYLLLEK